MMSMIAEPSASASGKYKLWLRGVDGEGCRRWEAKWFAGCDDAAVRRPAARIAGKSRCAPVGFKIH
jgi:hypothetical protein